MIKENWSMETNQTSIELTTQQTPKIVSDDAGGEYLFVLPVIVIVGLCGNIASIVTILNTRLRKIAANQYLIVLTASDSVFLVGMILIFFKIDFLSFHLCVLVEYVLMVSSYVSAWSVVALTIERYIAIVHPMKHVKLSHIPRTTIMRYWVPIPFFLNLVQFVTLTPPPPNNKESSGNETRQCAVASGQLQLITEMVDVFISYAAPCIIVIILNLIIVSAIYRSRTDMFGENKRHSEQRLEYRASRRRGGNTNSGSTRILLVVPIVYTLLNTPFYFMRVLDTLFLNLSSSNAFSGQDLNKSKLSVLFYNGAHYLYYINFASDFLVYAFSSSNFRKSVILAWTKLLCPASWQKKTKRMKRMDMGSQRSYMPPTTSQCRPIGDPV